MTETTEARANQIREAFDRKKGFVLDACHKQGRCRINIAPKPQISFRLEAAPLGLVIVDQLLFELEWAEPPNHCCWRIMCEGVLVFDGVL